jgi:hypothetical protein
MTEVKNLILSFLTQPRNPELLGVTLSNEGIAIEYSEGYVISHHRDSDRYWNANTGALQMIEDTKNKIRTLFYHDPQTKMVIGTSIGKYENAGKIKEWKPEENYVLIDGKIFKIIGEQKIEITLDELSNIVNV